MSAGALLLLLAFSAPAGPPPTLVSVEASWDARARAAIDIQVKALESLAIPPATYIDRLEEWSAKGASGARCATLLESMAVHAAAARALLVALGEPTSADVVVAAADALAAGASADSLKTVLAEGAHPSSTELGLRCLGLTSLLAQGVASADAADLVVAAAGQGYRSPDYDTLLDAVAQLWSQAAAREAMLVQLGGAIRQGVAPPALSSVVRQALQAAPPTSRATTESGFNHSVTRQPR